MSTASTWTTRRVPALSVCLIAVLLVYSFILHPFGKGDGGKHNGAATIPQLILSVYTVFLHVLSILFPFRASLSMRHILQRTRQSLEERPTGRRRRVQSIVQNEKEQETPIFPSPLFVIILPAYKEEVANLEETLRVLASHPQARYSYHVYLAMEEKEEKSAFKAASLCTTFDSSFFRMSYTIHPSNIPGEAQGKSSNESWAAKQAMRDYPDDRVKQNTVITVMDADTHLSSRYFTQITRLHNEHPETNESTIYVPPLVFDRNLHHVPLFVRTADMMWAGAGLSSLYDGSTVCIPTSVYSLPMTLVEHVGGWDTDPTAIGEDMHMYLKCFFALSGHLTVQKVYVAASQCDVSVDEKGLFGWVKGLQARYKQALRHMWGALDTGYSIREFAKMLARHRAAKRSSTGSTKNSTKYDRDASYTSIGFHKSLLPAEADSEDALPKPIHKANVFVVFHRLFEAHFLPIHLAVILTSSAIYTAVYPNFLIPPVLKVALDISGWCRLIGFSTMLVFFYLYERYHRLCLGIRKEEMRSAGMLEDMEENDGFTPQVFQYAGLLEAALFPIGGFIFGAIPALQAVLSHVFTDRLTYVVSLKPQLVMKPFRDISRATP